MKYLLTFKSVHYAIDAEVKLKENFNIRTIPTPREISSSCGLSVLFLDDIELISLKSVKKDILEKEIKLDKLYLYRTQDFSKKNIEVIKWEDI